MVMPRAVPGPVVGPVAGPEATPGRERQLRLAEELLDDGTVRLVTFTGPAGVGKSWAARALVRRLRQAARPVVLVHIAEARSYEDLLVSVADAVRLRPGTGGLGHRLAATLAPEPYTLVVDGCDRLRGEPHPLARLLDLAPGLRIVATGLSPLHLAGERVVGIDPLAVPPASADGQRLRASEAMQMYLRRAGRVDPAFDPQSELAPAELAAAGELCRRVHGLPLGIEILATLVAVEPPSHTLARLDSGHTVTLPDARDTLEPHHGSVQAALDWSYAMLEPRAQVLLRRMAVFVGPATVDMLATVVHPDEPTGEAAYSEVLDIVDDLVDRRLVEPHRGPGEPAVSVVPLLREVALERLVDAGEQTRTEEAHTRAVLHLAQAHVEAGESVEDDVANAELARSEADLRAALRRSVGRADTETGLRLATALAPFVFRRGYDGFVAPALTSLLRHAGGGGIEDDLLARALLWRARLAVQFEGPEARRVVRDDLMRGLRLARRGGDQETVLLGLSFVLQALPVTGDASAATAAAEEGLPLAENAGDRRWAARFCAWVGMVASQTDRTEEALSLAERGLAHVDACGDSRARVLLALLLSGLPPERTAGLLRRLPPVGDLVEVAGRLEPRYEPLVLRMAATLALQTGDLTTAAAHCADCLRHAQRQGSWHDLPYGLLLLALVAARLGDLSDAARLHALVSGRLEALRPGLPPFLYHSYVDAMRSVRVRLGGTAFDALVAGRTDPGEDSLVWPLAYAVRAAGVEDRAPAPTRGGSVGTERLTPREREVLLELVTGATNNQISVRLGMAPKTVMHHSVSIYRKLGVRGRAEATAWAFRNGLVS